MTGTERSAGIEMFDPRALKVNPTRFQFRENTDAEGVAPTLRNVQKWRPERGNQIIVWEDKAGDRYVVDGHQRTGLARRLLAEGKEQDIQIPGVIFRESEGVTAEEATTLASLKNIAEGSASPIEAAKVLRSAGPERLADLPMPKDAVRSAVDLSRLAEEPFRMVINGVVEPNHAKYVGRFLADDPDRQAAAMKALARAEPANEDEAAVLVRRVAAAELAKDEAGAQVDMFGSTPDSTALEEVRIVAAAMRQLRRDKTLFAKVAAEADRIESTGSKIEREAAVRTAEDADRLSSGLDTIAFRAGPIRDKLKALAAEVKNESRPLSEARGIFVDALRSGDEVAGSARRGAGRPEREDQGGGEQRQPEGARDRPERLASAKVGPPASKEKTQRFDAGKTLSPEQRKQVLKTLVDVYKAAGLDKEFKGVDGQGNERWGYPYTPDLFVKSDITGAMVRYYVTLPDKRIAHPTELFPNYTDSDIEKEMRRREHEAREYRRLVKDRTPEDQQFGTLAEARAYWNRRSEESRKESAGGWPTIAPAGERVAFSKDGKIVLIPEMRLTEGQFVEALADAGWKQVTKPTTETVQTVDGPREQTVLPGAERISDEELARRRQAEAVARKQAERRIAPKKPQKAADEGLFGEGDRQLKLFRRNAGKGISLFTPSDRRALENNLRSIIGRVAGRRVQVEFRDVIQREGTLSEQASAAVDEAAAAGGTSVLPTIGGYWQGMGSGDALIAVALNDPSFDPTTTAFHEAWHQIEMMVLNEQERRVLQAEMPRLRAFAAREMDRSPNDPVVRAWPDYEITAIAFQRYARMKKAREDIGGIGIAVRRMFDKIMEVLRQVRRTLRGQGVTRYEDLFGRAYRGDFAARQEGVAGGVGMGVRGTVLAMDKPNVRTVWRGGFHPQDVDEAAHRIDRSGALFAHDDKLVAGEYGHVRPFDIDTSGFIDATTPEGAAIWKGFEATGDALQAAKDAGYKGAIYPDPHDWEFDFQGAEVAIFDPTSVIFSNSKPSAAIGAAAKDGKPVNPKVLASAMPAPRQTETEAFKRWFGKSKVVNKDGTPMVVYHGTDASFDTFSRHMLGSNTGAPSARKGFFFTDRPKTATNYSLSQMSREQRDDHYAAIYDQIALYERLADERPYDPKMQKGLRFQAQALREQMDEKSGPNIMPVYLSIQNPLVHDFKGARWRDVRYKALIDQAEREGRDGLILKRTYDGGQNLVTLVAGAATKGMIGSETVYIAFRPEQIKSVANRGTFDPANPSILASSIPMPGTVPGSILADRTERFKARVRDVTDPIRLRVQDRYLAIKRFQEGIEKQIGRPLDTPINVYQAIRLYTGRGGEKLVDLQSEHIEPLIEDMRARKVSGADLDDYLYARHAPERNREMAKINPGMTDGSGMSDAEAQAVMDRFAAEGRTADLEALAARVDAINTFTRRELVTAGLIDPKTALAWKTKYPNYVPLRGFDDPAASVDQEGIGLPKTGKGFDVRGPESKQALGRRSKADSPLAYVVQQAERAIVRAEKNRTLKTVLRFAQDPAVEPSGIIKVNKAEMKRRVDPVTGLVETYAVPPQFSKSENLFAVKIGGKTHWMTVEHPGFARALRGVGSGVDNALARGLLSISHTYAKLLTQWNPEFVPTNAVRDLQTALVNVSEFDNLAKGTRRKILKDAFTLKSIRGAMAAMYGKATSNDMAPYYDEFRRSGGKVSYVELNEIDAIKKRIDRSVKAGDMRRALGNAMDLVGNLNTAVENGVRLSVYANLRKAGVEKDRAAFIARDLTTDFNLRGEWGPTINALYIFFNASIQGTFRMARAVARSRTAQIAVASIFAAGFGMEFLNALLSGGDDDDNPYDKIPEYEFERNMIIMLPGGDYVKLPLAYGYNVPYIAGQQLARLLRGKTETGAAAAMVGTAAIDSFNPLGTVGSIGQLAAPWFVDPFVQSGENKNFAGSPIMPTQYDEKKPLSESYWKTAPSWAKWVSRQLNEATGGNVGRPGAVDISPETIQHYVEFAGGGVGRFLANAYATGEKIVTADELLPEKMPFVRRFYGKTDTGAAVERQFFDAWAEIDQAHYEQLRLKEAGDTAAMTEARETYRPEIAAYGAFNSAMKARKKLREARDAAERIDDADARKARLEQIDERERAVMDNALSIYRRAKGD